MATTIERIDSIIEAAAKLKERARIHIGTHGDGGAEFDVLDRIDGDLWDLLEDIEEKSGGG